MHLLKMTTMTLIALLMGCIPPPQSDLTFSVAFTDPDREGVAYYDQLENCLVAAGETWGQYLEGDASIEVEVMFERAPGILMSGGSTAAVQIGKLPDGCRIFDWNTAEEIRSGRDVNGGLPDALIVINPDCLPLFYYEADPWLGLGFVPADKHDAYTAFLHEFGHILAYNGWLELDGTIDCLSIYDTHIAVDDRFVWFKGEKVEQLKPTGLRLDMFSYVHTADPSSLMFDTIRKGVRKSISDLDLAVLEDCGLPLRQ